MKENPKEKKIVFLVSLQWFMEKDINKGSYKTYFSELQFYQTMKNPDISETVKQYICKRTEHLSEDANFLEAPWFYSYLYSQDNILSSAALTCLKPYYAVKEKFLTLKDKHRALKTIKKFENEPAQEIQNIDWAAELAEAEQSGQTSCTNNDFYIDDTYYDTYLRDRIGELKNCNENVDLLQAKELGDFEAMLKICQQTEIEPFFIFIPTNGYYYDYTGLTQDKRNAFYDKIEGLTGQYGFSYYSMRDKEYEPYILYDAAHLGWKGWLHVSEQVTKHFAQSR